MKHLRMFVPLLLAVTVFMLMSAQDAYAQKKKVPAKPDPVVERTPSAAPQTGGKTGNTLKDMLMKFKGELTTIGVLKQVEFDYFVVEEEGTMTIHPISAISSIKILKPEEGGDEEEESPKLDIRLQ